MSRRNSQVKTLEVASREAMFYVFNIFDEMTGGCFKKGYRDMSKVERLNEWDMLGPEQFEQLKQTKGPEWLASQGAEIERIRSEMDGMRPSPDAVPLQP